MKSFESADTRFNRVVWICFDFIRFRNRYSLSLHQSVLSTVYTFPNSTKKKIVAKYFMLSVDSDLRARFTLHFIFFRSEFTGVKFTGEKKQ